MAAGCAPLGGGHSLAADVKINACDIPAVQQAWRGAKVYYSVTNGGSSSHTYFIGFEVKDSSGIRVGQTRDGVADLGPGTTTVEVTTVPLDSSGGAVCSISEVS